MNTKEMSTTSEDKDTVKGETDKNEKRALSSDDETLSGTRKKRRGEMSKKKDHIFVFLEISLGEKVTERVVIKLDVSGPHISTKEFLVHCIGVYEKNGARLNYKGVPRGLSGPGMVHFDIHGHRDQNLFFISFRNKRKMGWTATGQVIEGIETVRMIKKMGAFVRPPTKEELGDPVKFKNLEKLPIELVTITNCGEIDCEDEINRLMDISLKAIKRPSST